VRLLAGCSSKGCSCTLLIIGGFCTESNRKIGCCLAGAPARCKWLPSTLVVKVDARGQGVREVFC
jgi:hypothetical protein